MKIIVCDDLEGLSNCQIVFLDICRCRKISCTGLETSSKTMAENVDVK